MKRIVISALISSLPLIFAGCEHQAISTGLDCNITLDSGNTYYAGTPVRFNIDGAVDNIIFYSGEFGSEYQYRDRYLLSTEDVASADFTLRVQHHFGNAGTCAIEIFYTNDFEGLLGNDGAADRATIAAMYDKETGTMEGWKKLEFNDPGPKSNTWWDPDIVIDLKEEGMLDNFCMAFHWNPPKGVEITEGATSTTRYDTYRFSGTLNVTYNGGFSPYSATLKSLADVSVMMSDYYTDPYYKNSGNGSIRLNDGTYHVVFAGGLNSSTDIPSGDVEGWLFTAPQQLSKVDSDKAMVIKNIQNSLSSYEYTWDEPGTYKVTFVCSSTDYLESDSKVIEYTVNILDTPVQKQ